MVASRLDNMIKYIDTKKINKDDINLEKSIYEITINNSPILIALGREKITNSVAAYSIYLIFEDKIDSQIGIYEAKIEDLPNLLDSVGDPDLEKFDPPILYSFVTNTFLEEKKTIKELVEHKEPEEPEDIETNNTTFDDDNDDILDIDEPDVEYIPKDSDYWLNKHFNTDKFNELDNEGGGDCLFAVIRDAMNNSKITISYLREILAEEATEELFSNNKLLYDNFNDEIVNLTKNKKEVEKEFTIIGKKHNEEKDRDKKVKLKDEAIAKKKEHEEIKSKIQGTNELIDEFRYLKGINNLDQFKEIIKTNKYWADTWAISTLERILNIKLIILSRERYLAGDLLNILQCGQNNDTILDIKGVFKPKYYILTDYLGRHYILSKYMGKSRLTFKEIPKAIKELIVDKCLERKSGIYSLIPKMIKYKEKLNKPEQEAIITPVDMTSDLYDGTTEFHFYSRSADSKPGKGSGEKINEENRKDFLDLSKIKDWRKKLSNFWIQPFELDGHKWNSVEHYYQANKFKYGAPDYYIKFTVDSNTDISKDPKLAKVMGSKIGKVNKDIFRPKDIKIDEDFYSTDRSVKIMNNAQKAKFTQLEELNNMLKLTRYARLMHIMGRGTPAKEFTYLMQLRKELVSGKNS